MKKNKKSLIILLPLLVLLFGLFLIGSLKHARAEVPVVAVLESSYGQRVSIQACISLNAAYGGVEQVEIGFLRSKGRFNGNYLVATDQAKTQLQFDNNFGSNNESPNFPNSMMLNYPDLFFNNYKEGKQDANFYVGLAYNTTAYTALRKDVDGLGKKIIDNGGQKIPISSLSICSDSSSKIKKPASLASISPSTTVSKEAVGSVIKEQKNPKIKNNLPTFSWSIDNECSITFSSDSGHVMYPILSGSPAVNSYFTITAQVGQYQIHDTGISPCKGLHLNKVDFQG
jgi:hypothetical protein